VDDRERRSVADDFVSLLMTGPPPLMVEARRVLMEALDALADHRGSLVLVGAQAVYLRTDEIALSFSASYTTDADLAEKLPCRKLFDDKPDSQRRRVEHLRRILVAVLFARMVHDVRRYVLL